ncbi:ribonuclease III, partial [Bacillus cereus]
MPYRKYREKKYETKYREAFKVFQEKIGITFTDEKLLIQA